MTREACAREVHAVDDERRVYRGARAIAEAWRRLGWPWRALGWLTAYPLALPASLVYSVVAKNRTRLGPKDGACRID